MVKEQKLDQMGKSMSGNSGMVQIRTEQDTTKIGKSL